ncbi:NRAMP family divalent metal transporter [Fusobacterium sp. PH5-44]|uniref:NRAMP family divalent metal transporter n=1 Tax=unclassified Fusobacterium TaxID=2648384 RepID=UPI003D199D8D
MAEQNKSNKGALIGAAFLMATSAIGPGFLTQTAKFTEEYKSNFAFVILISIIITLVVQLNIWRVIGVSGMRGQDIANKVMPGLGYIVAGLVALGGLAFNIGNVGGAALGLNVLLGVNIKIGTVITGIVGAIIFISKDIGGALDKFTKYLGALMIVVIAYVAFTSKAPMGEVLYKSVMPDNVKALLFPIITLLGGTIGGYITFAGGHRLVEAGIVGKENLDRITQSSILGVTIASIVRILLFLAVLGVVSKGFKLDPANPPASAFKAGAGVVGYKIFGLVMLCAALTSVVGAAYTSVSFLKTLSPTINKYEKYFIIGFILVSTLIMTFLGSPAKLLVVVGSLNGLILPITLGVVLLGSGKKSIVGDYKHSVILTALGWVVVALTGYSGIMSLQRIATLFK